MMRRKSPQYAPPPQSQQPSYGAPMPQQGAPPQAGGDPNAAMAAWQAQYGAQWAACKSIRN